MTAPRPVETTMQRAVWQYRWLVAVVIVVVVALALVLRPALGSGYLAAAKVDPQNSLASVAFGHIQDPQERAANQIDILRSSGVAQYAAEYIWLRNGGVELSAGEVMAGLTARATNDSSVIVIEARNADPEVAVATANAIVAGYEFLLRWQVDEWHSQASRQRSIERISPTYQSDPRFRSETYTWSVWRFSSFMRNSRRATA